MPARMVHLPFTFNPFPLPSLAFEDCLMSTPPTSTRRAFLKKSGHVAIVSTLVADMTPRVHAAEENTIQVALVGSGGRDTGAAVQALSTSSGPIKLVAV